MSTAQRIAVIGAGSWGTALVKLLSANLDQVGWWVRRPDTIAHIRKFGHNPDYISAAQLDPARLVMDSDIRAVVRAADVLVLAVPSAFVKRTLDQLEPEDLDGRTIFSAVKGIVPETNQIVGEFLFKHWGVRERPRGDLWPLPRRGGGHGTAQLPHHRLPGPGKAKAMGDALNGRFMKTSLSDDIYGTEYAAILKNVIAVCAGISVGLGYGDNFRAVLVSRAIQEIARFVQAVHPIARDINEPAYLGDLLVTAYSTFSRNREFGAMVGKGYSVKAAQLEMNMVAEGYHAVKCVHEINAQLKVDMPITESTYRMLYEKMAPLIEMRLLSEKLA